jgi:DNA-binding beta-propeller fold protein YncE
MRLARPVLHSGSSAIRGRSLPTNHDCGCQIGITIAPSGIFAVISGRVAFCSFTLYTFLSFNAVDGTYVRSLGQAVVGGSTARDGLNQPTGIVCYDGRVFIADSQNHRVQVYREESGIHLMCVGKGKGAGEGQLNLPMGLAIDPTTRLLYVCECGNRRVTVFSSENYSFRAFLGEPGNGQGQFQKPEVCSFIIFAVNFFNSLRVSLLEHWLLLMQSVCVDSTNNFVYVTDNYLNRVLVFNTVK